MNKFLLVAFALITVFNSVFCGDSSEEVLELIKSNRLKQYVAQNREHLDDGLEKLEKKCPGVTGKLKGAMKQFHDCDEKTDESLTICAAIQTYTLNCTKPLLQVVDDCLPEKARGLPILGVKSLLSVADYLCKQSGESLFELANPCLWEDEDESNETEDECDKKIKEIASKYDNSEHVPSKAEVCTSATSLRNCLQTHTSKCKNQKTKDIAMGVYDALVAPCSHVNEV